MALFDVEGVINFAKTLIEEANDANVITQNELINFVDKAQKWVAAESGCLTDWGTVTLAENTVRYTPPTGTSVVLGVEYDYESDKPGVGVRNLTQVSETNIPQSPDDTVPYYWMHRGNKLCIYPSMPVSPINTTANVLFTKLPATVSALSDDLSIPDEFQIVVPYRVAEQVAEKDNQLEKKQLLNMDVQRLIKEGIAQYSGGAFTSAPAGPPAGGAG